MSYYPKKTREFSSCNFSGQFGTIINECECLNETYGLTYLIKTCKRLIDTLDDLTLDKVKKDLPLVEIIIKVSLQTYGLRALYAGFLWIAGDKMNADLQIRIHNIECYEKMQKLYSIMYKENN